MPDIEQCFLLLRYLFAFLAFPFVALSIYLFFAFANDLTGTKVSSRFNRSFCISWGILFLIQVVLARNYFYTKEENTIFIFLQAINILGLISFFITPFYILSKIKNLQDVQQKRAAKHFSIIYLLCFGMASLFTSRIILPFFAPFTVLLMILSFFAVNLPPLIYLIICLKKYPVKNHQPTSHRIRLEDFCVFHKISNREQEIIELILKGMSNIDIEKKLYISPHTVKNHIYNIYQKLGVKNRVQISNLVRDHHRVLKD